MDKPVTIERIANFSFPSNHLVNFQLIRDLEKAQSIKPEYFFFVSLNPGASGDNGARTYNFQENISLKYGIHEIAGLSFALKQASLGNAKAVNYVKFSKSSTGNKSISITEGPLKEIPTKNGPVSVRQIFLSFASNSNVKQLTLTLDQAYSIGEMLDVLFKKGAELELSRVVNTVSYNRQDNRQNNRQDNRNNFNNQQVIDDSSPFDDSDSNSNFLGNGFTGFGSNPFG